MTSFSVGRLAELVRGLAGGIGLGRRDDARPPDLATQEALRDSEERLRLVRRATGLGMYEIDWVARRRYWSPELRAILCVPDDLDINADTDLLERIIPEEMRAKFRAKLRASLSPESGGDYDDEHRITRFDGTTGWILLRGKTFFAEGSGGRQATRSIGRVVDITDRKRGEEANALHLDGPVLERCDLLDRSRPDHQDMESRRRAALWLFGIRSDRQAALDPSRPGATAGASFSPARCRARPSSCRPSAATRAAA